MQAIIGIGLIVGGGYLICMAFAFALIALIFILANFLTFCDFIFSLGGYYPPFLCWAVTGFVLGSILSFVSQEAPALRRPELQFFLVVTGFIFLFLAPLGLKAVSTLPQSSQTVQNRPLPEQQSSRPQPLQPQRGERKTIK